MSFRWPELLWAVLLVPLVLLLWSGESPCAQRAGSSATRRCCPTWSRPGRAGGGFSR